jgi:hypothetical protein
VIENTGQARAFKVNRAINNKTISAFFDTAIILTLLFFFV